MTSAYLAQLDTGASMVSTIVEMSIYAQLVITVYLVLTEKTLV
jgi:hypothetical protein